MTTEVTVPNTVKSITAVTNSTTIRKILTEDNFEVESVALAGAGRDISKVVATVIVDLAAHQDGAPLLSTDRYSRRKVELNRINLKDILEYRGVEKNDKGQYLISGTDAAAVIAALGTPITEEEFTIRTVGDSSVVTASESSYGYCGKFTFAGGASAAASADKAEALELTNLNLHIPAVKVGEEVKVSLSINPANYQPKSVTYKATLGKVVDGKYIATQAGTDTVEVTVDGKTAKTTVTVSYPSVTKVTLQAPAEVVADSETQLSLTIEPANANPDLTPHFDTTNGLVDAKGVYLAPSVAGEDKITVTVEGVSTTVTIKVVEA